MVYTPYDNDNDELRVFIGHKNIKLVMIEFDDLDTYFDNGGLQDGTFFEEGIAYAHGSLLHAKNLSPNKEYAVILDWLQILQNRDSGASSSAAVLS